ncbi:MAG: prepilin-type N-terminal cleavage/methylation protein [Proteobacteria bacterium]|nr:prepilin-type N-terminal cleavage/methylation protein [Pseudomonadota bacterium]
MTALRLRSHGFTLVELAIVLIILALLSGGLMMTLSSQMDQRSYRETQQQLQDIRDALLGYAASHPALDGKPYLPCPDTDGDGVENRTGYVCTAPEGTLPWSDLGIGNRDAWGNRFRYRVENNFSRKDIGFTLSTSATLRICEQAACTSTLATGLPTVIISHGKNGFGATTSGNTANDAPTGIDELENANSDANFVSHTPSPAGANEFDDLVIWLSPNILYNRLIAAGRLP